MGFFDKIKEKIFGHHDDKPTVGHDAQIAKQAAETIGRASAEQVAAAPTVTPTAGPAPKVSPTVAMAPSASAGSPSQPVDVSAVMDAAVARSGQDLNWKTSIVDLMKALDLDSSITARKELADELGYTGDKSDSASMNIWLHKQVLTQLAANGGKVPDTLLA